MAEWRAFANKQKQKRMKGKKGSESSEAMKDEIVVQRMSSEVSGKQQKYSRVGAQEYVPFEYEQLTFDNIIDACQKHFATQIDKGMVCDILAGERGPSCKKMMHISGTKVFYVRFIERKEIDSSCAEVDDEPDQSPKQKQNKKARYAGPKTTASVPSTTKTCTSKFYPKSLSIRDMMKLGGVLSKKSATIISIFKFNFQHMEWSTMPLEAEFMVAETPFASGGFREAFKATSITDGFGEVTWVVKKYLQSALEDIKETKQTTESHTQKAVQMHYLARNFASQLKNKIENEDLNGFGPTFEYKKVFMGKTDAGEYVTIEEFISGEFVKYLNNNGDICVKDNEICEKAQSFVHFTYAKSEGKVMVLDIQGSGYSLYDPEIASADLLSDDGAYQFCAGNLSEEAMKNFFANHKCNYYCNLLKLQQK